MLCHQAIPAPRRCLGAPTRRTARRSKARGLVAASTQNQALHALLFHYQDVLGTDRGWLDDFVRAKRPSRLPEVLSREEVKAVLELLRAPHDLICGLFYGGGLRVNEGLRLRVKDLDFLRGQLVVHDGKSARDRVTILPVTLRAALQHNLAGTHWRCPSADRTLPLF